MQAVVVKGGSTQQAGLQFLSLPQGRDKGPIQIRTLSLPCGRDKTGAPSVVLTPPPCTTTTQPTHFYHGAVAV